MFGIDFSEILVIFVIALVVLGPEKLPKLAATIGRWVGRARAMARQFREQLEQEAANIQRATDLKTPPPPAAAAPYGAAPTGTAEAASPATGPVTPTPDTAAPESQAASHSAPAAMDIATYPYESTPAALNGAAASHAPTDHHDTSGAAPMEAHERGQ